MRATLTSKCQFTLPAPLRKQMNLAPGDQLEFTLRPDGRVELRPVKKTQRTGSIMDLKGILKGKLPPMSLKEMEDAIAEGAAEGNLPVQRKRRSA